MFIKYLFIVLPAHLSQRNRMEKKKQNVFLYKKREKVFRCHQIIYYTAGYKFRDFYFQPTNFNLWVNFILV